MTSKNLRVAIIGAGASGIMALIKMRQAGIKDVTIFEKADDLGGTWRDNRYPGLTCDVPSHLYRYEFEANPDWSYVCSPGAEILAYFRAVAHKYGVVEHIKYAHEVIKAEWLPGPGLTKNSRPTCEPRFLRISSEHETDRCHLTGLQRESVACLF